MGWTGEMHLHGYSLDVRERQRGQRWLTCQQRRVCMSDSDRYCNFPASVRGTLVVHWWWGRGWG